MGVPTAARVRRRDGRAPARGRGVRARADHQQQPGSTVPSPPLPTTTRDGRRRTFYDDPELSYAAVGGHRLTGWDAKLAAWLLGRAATPVRVVMVSGSQPEPCAGKDGDHLLLRFLKNKLDYCRLHGIELLYNRALLQPDMGW
jgi:hypothetical protein